jgi:hypothetical protein
MAILSRFSSISLSVFVWGLLGLSIVTFRSTHIAKDEISWDVLGYYLPLPATFIYSDPMLDRTDWIEQINQERKLSSSLYQVSSTPEGKPMYFFLFGTALFYLPFFLIGHGLAFLFGFHTDGFSMPYQYTLALGCVIYTLIGLWYLRKVLLEFYSEKITSLVMVIVVLATNYAHHMTLKNLETVNLLFMCCALLIWHTVEWHKQQRFLNLFFIGLSVTLATLIKPSEILMLLIPICWGIFDRQSLLDKFQLVWKFRFQLFCVMLLCSLLFIPQAWYWYMKTGKPLYDSYKNPGVGLDFLSPHVLETLFSYRKGWLLYTPVMIFALMGFATLFSSNRQLFYGVVLPFIAFFWLVSSWTEWWYGAGFSNRPLIAYYPLLAFPLGSFFQWTIRKHSLMRYVLGLMLLCFLVLNQFQWWQLRNYILDPYRTTKEYYWATFLKTTVTEKDKELLLIDRSFWGEPVFKNREGYRLKRWLNAYFDDQPHGYLSSSDKEEFAFTHRIPYQELTTKDHVWVRVSFKYKTMQNNALVFAMMFDRVEGAYGYKAWDLPITSTWKEVEFFYLTPEVRSIKDELKFDFWKKTPCQLFLDEFQLDIYEQK